MFQISTDRGMTKLGASSTTRFVFFHIRTPEQAIDIGGRHTPESVVGSERRGFATQHKVRPFLLCPFALCWVRTHHSSTTAV